MPYSNEWVEPEVMLAYRGVTVWYTYRDDDIDQGIFEHWFTLDPQEGCETGDDLWVFDVRDLPRPDDEEERSQSDGSPEDIICQAIDAGQLTRMGVTA